VRPKVVHITTVHSPFDPRILERECRSLADSGYDVTVLAPHDGNGSYAGVTIRGVPGARGRLSRMTSTTRHILKAALSERADVYHFHDPELLPVGVILATLGKRVIYDAHEDVRNDILTKHYLSRPARYGLAGLAATVELAAVATLAGVVAATPVIGSRFPIEKTTVVQNFPRLEEFPLPEIPYAERPNQFIYVGSVTAVRGGKEMLDALARISEELAVRLVLAGRITPPAFEETLRSHPAAGRVDFRGWSDPKTLPSLFQSVRAGLVVLHPTQGYLDSYPGKMFEYMAAGLPVIASDFPLWREILSPARAGLLVDPLDPNAIADAMRWILENPCEAQAMGQRGRAAVEQRYNWQREEKKLLGLYARLAPAVSRG
jgi:glycosyltransferase involved in cell wall biosynthesis